MVVGCLPPSCGPPSVSIEYLGDPRNDLFPVVCGTALGARVCLRCRHCPLKGAAPRAVRTVGWFSTAGSHGCQGPELCTPDAVLNGSCTLL